MSDRNLLIDPDQLKESTSNIQQNIMDGKWPNDLETVITRKLSCSPFSMNFLAVRSSGTDEDSAAHSFAGNFCLYKDTMVNVAPIIY